jgi:hypothetical protein
MGLTMSRVNRRMLSGLENLSPAELRTVARASSRGPVPADTRLRGAVVGLVQRRLDEVLRTRRRSVVTFAALLVLYVAWPSPRHGGGGWQRGCSSCSWR